MPTPSPIKPPQRKIKIGARASRLSQLQAARAAGLLGIDAAIIGYKTAGDAIQNKHLRDLGGKELFVRDIERALLKREIDLAIHSLKDMPAQQPEGVIIAAILPREDARDALVSTARFASLAALPENSRIGTASPRRTAQIKKLRPDLEPVLLRGNVDRRLQKIAQGEIDAALLAMAGLERLGQTEMAVPIATDIILPAAAQGTIIIECREDDAAMRALSRRAHHAETETLTSAERSFAAAFGTSCHIPAAALAIWRNDEIHLTAELFAPEGEISFRHQRSGTNPRLLGQETARHIARMAGEEILKKIGADIADIP